MTRVEMMPGERVTYVPQLDGLRAIAVMLVIFHHWVPRQYHGSIDLGQLGVQLFFVRLFLNRCG